LPVLFCVRRRLAQEVSKFMFNGKRFIMLLLIAVLSATAPLSVSAASLTLSTTAKTNLDRMAAKADPTLGADILRLYGEFLAVQEQDRSRDAQIKALQYANEESRLALQKQMKQLDADKISKLQAQVDQAQKRYKPLFDLYGAMSAKLKPASGLKLSVDLARTDIRLKRAALKSAKDSAAAKVKLSRETLSDKDPIEVQIKAKRSAANFPKRQLAAEWTSLGAAIKQNDARSAYASLSSLVLLSKQIVQLKQQIYALEQKIGEITKQAKARLA